MLKANSLVFLCMYWFEIRAIAGVNNFWSIVFCPEMTSIFVRRRQSKMWDNTEHLELLGKISKP